MTDLVYATANDISTLEPTQVSGFMDHTAAHAIFGSLVMNFDGRSGDAGYFPWLAETVEAIDQNCWSIRLRDGLRFHDGAVLDAEALKFSLERVLAPDFPSRRYMHTAPISRIEVTGPLEVILHTSEPVAILPARLFRGDASMVSPQHYSADPVPTAMQPVGAGPFRFVSYGAGRALTLAPHKDFVDGRNSPPPNFDRLVIRVVAERDELFAEMAAGTVDIAPISAAEAAHVEAMPGWRVVAGPDTTRMTLEINQAAHPALADVRVRRALNHAIDVDALLANLTAGTGQRITSLVNPPNADPALTPYAYDPAQARELLSAAGYGDGFALTIDWSAGPDRGALAAAVVPYLQAIGIVIEDVRERDWSTEYLPGQVAGTLGGLHGHGHAGVEMTAETDLWPLHPAREANSTNWSGPAADQFSATYAELQRETDPARQATLGNRLQRITHHEALSVCFWQMPRYVAVSDRVAHYLPYPGGHNEDFWTIRMAEGA